MFSLRRFFFCFELFDERVVKGSQVYVNYEVTVYLPIVNEQLFFGSEQKYFKFVMRKCDHHRGWLRDFGNVHLIIDFAVWHIKLFTENCLRCKFKSVVGVELVV